MSHESALIVTIDGPSGVGKSTISRGVAEQLGFTYLDTGAMYRAVALHMQSRGVDFSDVEAVTAELENISIELHPAGEDGDVKVTLNGRAVGHRIRTPEISMLASGISALPPVRVKLTLMQQRIGAHGRVVAEGRDTGTVVFPDAAYKFYLDATPQERASRRARQLRQRGEDVDEKALLAMTVTRDKNDSERAIAPLKKADDAVYIDTTGMSADQVLESLLSVIAEKNTP
jgi:cytidylate kinase